MAPSPVRLGGERDRSKRPLMGAVAARMSDLVVLTSDNPRGEDPQTILDEIVRGIVPPGDRPATHHGQVLPPLRVTPHLSIVDRGLAVERAVREARPGDTVLIAGKGHEKYQVIGDKSLPFDDVAVALPRSTAGSQIVRAGRTESDPALTLTAGRAARPAGVVRGDAAFRSVCSVSTRGHVGHVFFAIAGSARRPFLHRGRHRSRRARRVVAPGAAHGWAANRPRLRPRAGVIEFPNDGGPASSGLADRRKSGARRGHHRMAGKPRPRRGRRRSSPCPPTFPTAAT